MANINTVTLAGNLTRDPEQRYAPTGTAVTRFGLAINHRSTQGKDVKEETCFIDVTVFGPQAEAVSTHLAKGSQVLVEGRLRFQTWEDKAGQRHSKHEIVAHRVHFLGARRAERPGAETEAGALDEDIPF